MATKSQEKVGLKRRFFGSRLFLFVMLGVAILVAFGYARAYYQDYKIKQEIKNLQEEVSSLQKKRINSLDILKYVSSSAYVEDQARIELNMKKPGENVVFVSNPQEDVSLQDVSDAHLGDGQFISNPLKWLYYFIHKPLLNEE